MTTTMERVRAVWTRAASFPADKEAYYPEHARAHDFDSFAEKRVLEYGCGGGSDTASLIRRGAYVFYADVVPSNVAATRARVLASGSAHRAEGLVLERSAAIPLPDESVDAVTSHGVLHHIEEPLPVLAEFRRLLVPSGRLLVMFYTEHLRAHLAGQVAKFRALHPELSGDEAFGWATDGEGVPYARSYTEKEGRELFEAAGFDVVHTVLYNTKMFRTFWMKRA